MIAAAKSNGNQGSSLSMELAPISTTPSATTREESSAGAVH